MPLSVLNGGYKGEANAAPYHFMNSSNKYPLLTTIYLHSLSRAIAAQLENGSETGQHRHETMH